MIAAHHGSPGYMYGAAPSASRGSGGSGPCPRRDFDRRQKRGSALNEPLRGAVPGGELRISGRLHGDVVGSRRESFEGSAVKRG